MNLLHVPHKKDQWTVSGHGLKSLRPVFRASWARGAVAGAVVSSNENSAAYVDSSGSYWTHRGFHVNGTALS
jgi:hypothetical protein